MAKVFIEESTLTKIGNSIRNKTGKTELIDPAVMDVEIDSISGGGGLPEEAYVITGDCQYRFCQNGWNWFIDEFGNKITTKDIINIAYMFIGSGRLTSIPFDINLASISANPTPFNFYATFQDCASLTSLPRIHFPEDIENYDFENAYNVAFCSLLIGCANLRDAENLFDAEELASYMSRLKYSNEYNHDIQQIFSSCRSLRKIPSWYYALKTHPESQVPMYWNCSCNSLFYGCYALDEIKDLIIWGKSTDTWGPDSGGGITEQIFDGTFSECYRLKNITFETNNGTPYKANWTNQYINLTNIGWGFMSYFCTEYNSGITTDKQAWDDSSYSLLKNDPDWWTDRASYSRYNHDSAVATINSLPDTSEYVATAGGNNMIQFRGEAGSSTDGGAIRNLTEEEIAVATAKGWTVSIV